MSTRDMEYMITRYIVKHTMEDWIRLSSVDVAIVGAGPSGLTAAYYLAKKGYRVVVFERRLSFGGGIGGGGMLFHKIVADKRTKDILDEIGVKYVIDDDFIVMDSSELMAKLASSALDAGAKIIHGVTVEDVIYRDDPLRITGVVIQWSAVPLAGLHVDPLFIVSRAVVDATGHDAEVLRIVSRKVPEAGIELKGEKSAYSVKGEELVVEKTGRVIPGLYATGMAVAALYGLPRMGPIFSGMLLSGKKVAEEIDKDLRGK
ncbi:MAG: sulfide-dependent adenosine diphosphate thiazole synthase [Thermoprotei archaeon]